MILKFELTIEQTNACLTALDKQRATIDSTIQALTGQAKAQVEPAIEVPDNE